MPFTIIYVTMKFFKDRNFDIGRYACIILCIEFNREMYVRGLISSSSVVLEEFENNSLVTNPYGLVLSTSELTVPP